ncbi:hypothetical protein SAMN02745866_02433 [Alteromonadaceae bacterium Bs31]|nr:hypothetical protein SAMN02745866_02433 [Alteromonadaceae bacterium Bs31]
MSSEKHFHAVRIHPSDIGISSPRVIYKKPGEREVGALLDEYEKSSLNKLGVSDDCKRKFVAPWLLVMKSYFWSLPILVNIRLS